MYCSGVLIFYFHIFSRTYRLAKLVLICGEQNNICTRDRSGKCHLKLFRGLHILLNLTYTYAIKNIWSLNTNPYKMATY
ncbi:hypothetical protein XENTR_v10007826 [Xenopus tropicalis]|nr:hypothetical protein XENTR_v10007826 [Xenopus tropicalis]